MVEEKKSMKYKSWMREAGNKLFESNFSSPLGIFSLTSFPYKNATISVENVYYFYVVAISFIPWDQDPES